MVSETKTTELDIAVGQLVVGAFFFAMRSCEYLYVPINQPRKTKTLTLENIRFWKNNRILQHNDPTLNTADVVAIKFVKQKNEKDGDIINQFKSRDDAINPVKAWADLVTRISSYPKTRPQTQVNQVQIKGKLVAVTSAAVTMALRKAVRKIGKTRL